MHTIHCSAWFYPALTVPYCIYSNTIHIKHVLRRSRCICINGQLLSITISADPHRGFEKSFVLIGRNAILPCTNSSIIFAPALVEPKMCVRTSVNNKFKNKGSAFGEFQPFCLALSSFSILAGHYYSNRDRIGTWLVQPGNNEPISKFAWLWRHFLRPAKACWSPPLWFIRHVDLWPVPREPSPLIQLTT